MAHCGPTLKGEFARTLALTDVATGWVHMETMRNNAHKHIRRAPDAAIDAIPYQVQGLDCDNGSELINYDVLEWAADQDIFFTRARPYKKNDQAMWSQRISMLSGATASTIAMTQRRNATRWPRSGSWYASR